MSGRLDGKVAVVTGGSSGIGLGIAKRFASEGATVFITGRREAELSAAAAALGNRVVAVRADMSMPGDIDLLYREVRRRHQHVDIIVANAGGGEFAPLGEISPEHFDRTFATNVRGVLFTVQKALPLLIAGSSVILIGSTAGSRAIPAFSVYSATKAAVRSFARGWALDLSERHIRVNVLSPGPIDTPGSHNLTSSEEDRANFRAATVSSVPLGRFGDVDEVAGVALFLASDDASFVTGAEYFVDGGSAQV